MSNGNDYFRQVEQMAKSANAALKPIRENKELLNSLKTSVQITKPFQDMSKEITKPIRIMNEQFATPLRTVNIIGDIMKPFREQMESIRSLNDYLSSYNATREFVNNYDVYIDDLDSEVDIQEVEKVKEKIGVMPDIEEDVDALNPKQKEQVEEIAYRTYTRMQQIDADKQKEIKVQRVDETQEKGVGDIEGAFLGLLLGEEVTALTQNIPTNIVEAIEMHLIFIMALIQMFGS